MRRLFACIFAYFFIFSISAFGQTAQQLVDAYQQNSPQMLEEFLLNWSKELPPLSEKKISKRDFFEKQAYSIFKKLYNPRDLALIGGSQFGDDAYVTNKYFIIRPWIDIYQSEKVYYSDSEQRKYAIEQINKRVPEDSLRRNFIKKVLEDAQPQLLEYYGPYGLSKSDTIVRLKVSLKDFRPPINNGIPLYLNEKYANELKTFLGNENSPFATHNSSDIAQAIGKSKQKMEFLSNYIRVFYSHWGDNWDLSTPPIISKITFDKKAHFAMVEFGLIYEGGVAFLENKKSKWSLISAKRTWRE